MSGSYHFVIMGVCNGFSKGWANFGGFSRVRQKSLKGSQNPLFEILGVSTPVEPLKTLLIVTNVDAVKQTSPINPSSTF